MKKNIKRMSIAAMAALAMVSCSNHDEWMTYEEFQAAQYNAAFVQKYGQIDPNHDWGFGSTRAVTRAAATWDGNHSCAADWTKLNFSKPEGATDLTRSDLFPDGNNLGDQFKNVTDWYIPADFEGSLSLHNMNLKGNVYVLGKLTDLQSVNYNGTVTFYVAKDAKLKYTVSSGNRHTIINVGELEIAKWSNVGELYNGGALTITDPDVHNTATIYSNGEATIEFPKGGDLKSTCDIHGTIDVTGNLKIQNSTSKYICGIEATGTVENVDGPLYTSYISANKYSVDGNKTFLLPGGYITAETVHIYNSGCAVQAAANSNALVEATDFIFENDNDFDRTFSENVYFQIDGSIDMSKVTNGTVKHEKYNDADAYIAANGNPNNKLNAGSATGSSACGGPWTVGGDKKITYAKRIICEDLGSTDDFDFNDVVFDALIKDGKTYIKLLAAGGTMKLTVAGVEVHEKFGVGVKDMVNTGAGPEKDPVEFVVEQAYDSYADIPVVVELSGEATENETKYELKNTIGAAPKKICVGTDYEWTNERQQIEQKYPGFKNYVGNYSLTDSWYK